MRYRVLRAQNISKMCMICGTDNQSGLHAAFFEVEDGQVVASFTPRPWHQGYPGRLHGGLAAAVLDETIGRAINIGDPDAWGVTVELHSIKYRRPVPLEAEIRVRAHITKDSSRLFEGTGELVLPDGTVAVEASGKYLKLAIDKITEGDFHSQWFEDSRPTPDYIEL